MLSAKDFTRDVNEHLDRIGHCLYVFVQRLIGNGDLALRPITTCRQRADDRSHLQRYYN